MKQLQQILVCLFWIDKERIMVLLNGTNGPVPFRFNIRARMQARPLKKQLEVQHVGMDKLGVFWVRQHKIPMLLA